MEPMSGISSGPDGCEPDRAYCVPLGWASAPAFAWCIERTTASLSARWAVFASSSVNCIPGTRVEIGLYGLRSSLIWRGLGSQVSMCDSPPCS